MNKKQFSGKRVLTIMALLLFVILAWNEKSVPVQAESGTITFSTASQQVKKGAKVVVVCQIIAASEFMDAEFVIDYDSEYLQFVKGAAKYGLQEVPWWFLLPETPPPLRKRHLPWSL